jgi:hypothetical protein
VHGCVMVVKLREQVSGQIMGVEHELGRIVLVAVTQLLGWGAVAI